jgi:asparagine synthase (glutamine-hydrolysing)
MCGIAGFLTTAPLAADRARADLARMTTALEHRGPDDAGHWFEDASGIALGHRRLSIVDLSPLGHQPMISASGRFVMTYNGEIYNYKRLSQELRSLGHSFRGTSDTEVLLAAIEQWGVSGTLDRAHGMFAFGLWDSQQKELHLARDRFGEKPLYFSQLKGQLLFASELKAFRAHSEWNGDIDRGSLALLLRHGFIPAPHTVFSNTRKVRPGCVLTVRARGNTFDINEREYWQPKALPVAGRDRAANADEQIASVHEALKTSIRQQMVADVPLGAFLSGGIDSSLIVSLMQQESSRPVRTFAIGFTEERFNEAPFAKRIAEHLGTDHTELIVTPAEARAVIPRLPEIYDEPFGDSSQIPTFLVCELARRSVTVSLSGDAGDELFGGYSRYTAVPAQWQRVRAWPGAIRRAAATFVNSLSPQTLELALAPAGRLRARPDLADRLQQHARAWQARSFAEFSHTATAVWPLPDRCVLGAQEPIALGLRTPEGAVAHTADELTHMMYVDTRVYLPDDILVKVDRAAMAVSLETRVPFLDPDVAEAAWRIDPVTHRRDGNGKWILRQILERYVPGTLFERPKKGFSVPVDRWMRNELRDWAEDLLDPSTLRRQGFFDASLIDRRWRQHLSGQTNWQYQLWSVLMFQSWISTWTRNAPSPGG